MNFIDAIKNTINNETIRTENGALGYRTTGTALLDLNFAVASLRAKSETEIATLFTRAYFENPTLAIKWMFFARDVRGGLGERRLFRACMRALAIINRDATARVLSLVPEYGRYDDLWSLIGTELEGEVIALIKAQLERDMACASSGESVSLIGKWLPSENASSAETKALARKIRLALGMSARSYRKTLSALRASIDIVEDMMSSGNWNQIEYDAVPSRANLIYRKAFLRNDRKRRIDFLERLAKGKTTINASVLFPHEIVARYNIWDVLDASLEALWGALDDTVSGNDNTLVVADGSGSMHWYHDGNVRPIDVANALAIYFAERAGGNFKDKYITFSSHPQLVDLSGADSLREKLLVARTHNEVANTNIKATFDLILETAVNNSMKNEDMPKNILIISDMEFDRATTSGVNETLFATIQREYKELGYDVPRLVFWNVASRSGAIPVKENALGVALVSGFSVSIVNMVMSGELDPYACLVSSLNTERYAPIEVALGSAS